MLSKLAAGPPSTDSHTDVSEDNADNANGQEASTAPTTHVGGDAESSAPLDIPRWKFWLVFVSLMLSVFLFALDQLILATATPKITETFNSFSELGWLTAGFFLTLLGFNLMYSQWLQIFPSKHVIMFAVFIFEVGSLLCGVAPTMNVLILGRAVAGLGAAGIFSGAMLVVAELTPLHSRAQYLALLGVVFAIASVIGPLVGGAFTQHVSWRWCFYINLPFGGLAFVLISLCQPAYAPLGRKHTYKGYTKDMLRQVIQCDWVGVAIAMAWACCVILSLQWGGVTKKWSNGSVIATLVMIPVLAIVFFLWEWWLGPEKAMFKLAFLRRRSIVGASIVLFCVFATFMLELYYLSIAFQAGYHASAEGAGIKLLPLVLVMILVLMASSRIIAFIGRFKWIIITGPCFLAIACGLLYTVKYGTSIIHLYGYQVIMGFGIGLTMQNCMLAVQFELKSEPTLISAGTGTAVFLGFAGRIVGISVATSVFENTIQKNLYKYDPQISESLVQAVVNSATAVWTVVPDSMRKEVLVAYFQSLRDVFIIGVPFSLIGIGGGLIMKNSRMQTKAEEEFDIQASREQEAIAKAHSAGGGKGRKEANDGGVSWGGADRRMEEALSARREGGDSAVLQGEGVAADNGIDARVVLDQHVGESPV